jgi:hypothetical protein
MIDKPYGFLLILYKSKQPLLPENMEMMNVGTAVVVVLALSFGVGVLKPNWSQQAAADSSRLYSIQRVS